MKKRLLLISNSFCYGQGYLDHCMQEIVNFLGDIKSILFIPYALKDHNWYELAAKNRFQKIGIKLFSIHKTKDPKKSIEQANSIFIGGGNTFRLLDKLYKSNLLDIIRKRVEVGMPYIGSSAGANVACPTIKTTNDMPIIEPPSFKALNLISFQINPHYTDPDKNSKYMGETRDQRIKEFLKENNTLVIGLREGSWLKIEEKKIKLGGRGGAKLFIKNNKPQELTKKNLTSIRSS